MLRPLVRVSTFILQNTVENIELNHTFCEKYFFFCYRIQLLNHT